MVTLLWILAYVMAYVFVGAVVGSRHHAVASRKCEQENCFLKEWCSHVFTSVYGFGLFWPFAIPAAAGVLIGTSNRAGRTESRRKREVEEAEHRLELARIRARETEALERSLH